MRYFLKDVVINNILGNEKFKDYTSAIISAVIDVPYEDIYNNLKYKSNRINDIVNNKNSIADNMYSLDNDIVNIEINYNYSRESTNKNMRYICHLLLYQVRPGVKDLYKNVIQININNYDFFKKGDFIYKSNIRDEKYNIKRSNLMEIYDINMDYLDKLSYNKVKKMTKDSLERLLYILICSDKNKREELCEGDELMEKINDELYKLTDDGVLYYDLEEFHNREARELGYEEGLEQGLEKGKKETIAIIEKFLESGMSKEDLSKMLEISMEELEDMLNEKIG